MTPPRRSIEAPALSEGSPLARVEAPLVAIFFLALTGPIAPDGLDVGSGR